MGRPGEPLKLRAKGSEVSRGFSFEQCVAAGHGAMLSEAESSTHCGLIGFDVALMPDSLARPELVGLREKTRVLHESKRYEVVDHILFFTEVLRVYPFDLPPIPVRRKRCRPWIERFWECLYAMYLIEWGEASV